MKHLNTMTQSLSEIVKKLRQSKYLVFSNLKISEDSVQSLHNYKNLKQFEKVKQEDVNAPV